MSFFPLCRNTQSTYSSVKAGKTNASALKARWRCFPWIISWPATSGPRTPSSSTGRSPSRTTWPHLTSCYGWKMTGLCSTPWGKTEPWTRHGNISFPIVLATQTWNAESRWVQCVVQWDVRRWLQHPSACNTSLVMVFKTLAAPIQPTRSYYMSQRCTDASLWCLRTVNWRSEELEMFALTQGTGCFTPPPPTIRCFITGTFTLAGRHHDLFFYCCSQIPSHTLYMIWMMFSQKSGKYFFK